MQKKDQLLQDFSTLQPFVQSLSQLAEETWVTPITDGKWTTRDTIAHIMLWDKYFLETAIEKVVFREAVTVQHLDFDEFNQKAVEYAKGKNKQEIIERTVHYRNEIVRCIRSMSEEEFRAEHVDGDGNKFSAYQYLLGFTSHDAHHINQINNFLTTNHTNYIRGKSFEISSDSL